MAEQIISDQQTTTPADLPAVQPAVPAPAQTSPKNPYVWGTGRRKKAVARVRIRPGEGKFLVNDRELEEFFRLPQDRTTARAPLEATGALKMYDIWVNVIGGGTTGQAGAIQLGVARALLRAAPELALALREKSLLTRDARGKERKKYGRRGARKGMQWAKR